MKKRIVSLLMAGIIVLSSCGASDMENTDELDNMSNGNKDNSGLVDGEIIDKEYHNVNQNQSGVNKKDITKLPNDLVTWGVGKQKNESNQPLEPLKMQEKYSDYNAEFIKETDEKTLKLTFDNGYENGNTTDILDTLKEKNVKAVFFLTYDYVKNQPELVQRMIDEGHEVGNHTYYHSSLPKVSLEKAEDNIVKLEEYVKENFDYDMKLFRFPMGEFSDKTLALVENYGYQSMFWSFAYKDWETDSQMGSEKALETLKNGLHPGAVYLLHSVSNDNKNILGDFIDYATSQGYMFE